MRVSQKMKKTYGFEFAMKLICGVFYMAYPKWVPTTPATCTPQDALHKSACVLNRLVASCVQPFHLHVVILPYLTINSIQTHNFQHQFLQNSLLKLNVDTFSFLSKESLCSICKIVRTRFFRFTRELRYICASLLKFAHIYHIFVYIYIYTQGESVSIVRRPTVKYI